MVGKFVDIPGSAFRIYTPGVTFRWAVCCVCNPCSCGVCVAGGRDEARVRRALCGEASALAPDSKYPALKHVCSSICVPHAFA